MYITSDISRSTLVAWFLFILHVADYTNDEESSYRVYCVMSFSPPPRRFHSRGVETLFLFYTNKRYNLMNIIIKVVGLIAVGLFTLADGGGFSSNVVTLNSRNWRKEVEESGQAVFINVW